MATLIFRIVDSSSDSDPNNVYYGKNGVAWLLRFGGASAFVRPYSAFPNGLLTFEQIGAAFSRAVAPTRTEKEMRRRLAEMKESEEAMP